MDRAPARRARRDLITAVDTSVVIDVFTADVEHGPRSREAMRRCLAEGTLVACEVVWSEVAAGFPSAQAAHARLDDLGIRFSAVLEPAALVAGDAYRTYRERGGSRERVVADFLIGAHATVQAERLLTRDRGFHRAYFGELIIVDPSMHPLRSAGSDRAPGRSG